MQLVFSMLPFSGILPTQVWLHKTWLKSALEAVLERDIVNYYDFGIFLFRGLLSDTECTHQVFISVLEKLIA
jgi:hypothetical protein